MSVDCHSDAIWFFQLCLRALSLFLSKDIMVFYALHSCSNRNNVAALGKFECKLKFQSWIQFFGLKLLKVFPNKQNVFGITKNVQALLCVI